MGATLTAEFLAVAGGLTRFPTADQLASAAGLAPVLQQSGKDALPAPRHRRQQNTEVRLLPIRVLRYPARPRQQGLLHRKRAEGKRHHQALIALARRRINVLHAILRTRSPTEPTTGTPRHCRLTKTLAASQSGMAALPVRVALRLLG